LKYMLLLGGVRIDGVIDVRESIKRDVKQYVSIGGDAFCEDRGAVLRFWQVEIELCLYDRRNIDGLLDDIKEMGEKGEPLLFSVNGDIGSFSSRVLVEEVAARFINSETCRVTLGLLQYVRPKVNVVSSSRPGGIPMPPEMTAAENIFRLTTQFSRVGTEIVVKNPLTGVDIDNIAAIDGDTLVKLEIIT